MRAVLKTLPDPHQLLPQPSLHDPVAASAMIVPFEYPVSLICLLRKLSISTPLPVSPPLFTLKIATVYYYYYYYYYYYH